MSRPASGTADRAAEAMEQYLDAWKRLNEVERRDFMQMVESFQRAVLARLAHPPAPGETE